MADDEDSITWRPPATRPYQIFNLRYKTRVNIRRKWRIIVKQCRNMLPYGCSNRGVRLWNWILPSVILLLDGCCIRLKRSAYTLNATRWILYGGNRRLHLSGFSSTLANLSIEVSHIFICSLIGLKIWRFCFKTYPLSVFIEMMRHYINLLKIRPNLSSNLSTMGCKLSSCHLRCISF